MRLPFSTDRSRPQGGSKSHAARRARARARQKFGPSLDALEPRQLLTVGAFLQGTAFDSNQVPLPGATIELFAVTGSTQTQIGQATTDSSGNYYFDDTHNLFASQSLVAPGTYQLVEIPPTNYMNLGAQVQTVAPLNTATVLNPSTIQVTIADPSQLSYTLENILAPSAEVLFSINGTPNGSVVPQFDIFLTEGNPPQTGPLFASYCVDPTALLNFGTPYQVTPETAQAAFPSGGQIAYLYNHYASGDPLTTAPVSLVQNLPDQNPGDLASGLDADISAGLQVAIWQLAVGSAFQLTGPGLPYSNANDYADIQSAESWFLNDASGKSEQAIVLAVDSLGQSLLAPQSMDFTNNTSSSHHSPPVNISGTKFNDLNGDGMQEGNEPVVTTGVTIQLDIDNGGTLTPAVDDMGNPIPATITDASGNYSFANVPALPVGESYAVQEVVPTGWTSTTTNPVVVSGTSGANDTGVNFGDFQNITISGTKFNDLTGNSFSSDDTGLGGVTIDLFKNGGSTPVATAVTAANGAYSFTNLGPGTYSVQEVVPTGSTQTGGNAGYVVNATSGTNVGNENFDDFQNIAISGTKFKDVNGNGSTTGDPTLSGVTIDLFKNGGSTPVATAVTAANGAYSFTNLGPGTYTVQEVLPNGWTETVGNAGYTVNATSGTNVANENFADFQNITISGTKFNDLTGNSFSSDDTGLGGVTIDLFKNGGSTPAATAVTAANGSYSFTNLGPGTYSVQEVVPTGSTQTGGNAGYVVNATSGVNSTGDNFDDFQNITISGTKFNDLTGNSFSSDDTGLGGVTIDLFKNGGSTPVATAVTAANGAYSFTNLGPGTYSVQEVVPTGSTQTGGNAGYVVNATSGTNVGNENFDDFQNITISGTKFKDVNGNGSTTGDPTLSGVTIDLFKNGGSSPVATAVTAANGAYSFTNLGPGTYTVQEVLPNGWTETVGNAGYTVNATSGTNVANDNFADFQNITISGTKFNDLTGNSFSSDDTGLGGVTIDLFKNGGSTPVATAVTAANGAYSFTNLGPGTYSVQEVVPAGSTQTGGLGGYSVTATSGTNVGNENFDDYQSIAISGTKFKDVNGNGSTTGDPTLSGVTIDLFKNGGSTPVATAVTDGNGNYSFTNLGAGTYTVQEVVPNGWTETVGSAGYTVNATSGTNVTNDNFADFQNICISGTKFKDVNGNGSTTGDPTLSGVTIDLFKNGGSTPVATAVTAANGAYSFTNLGPGTYTVQEVVPNGWTETVGNAGYTVNATSGTNVANENFADFQNICISGTKFKDVNGNGSTTGDPTLSGVTIDLFKNGGSTPVATAVTDGNGNYSFTNLGPGTYTVQEAVPTGWIETVGNAGYTVNATSGTNVANDNFADFQKITISGTKFDDLTGNSFSSDDTGLGGVTIDLFKNGGSTPAATAVTAANGAYSFTNLGPGTYSVQEVVPNGWLQTGGLGGYAVTATSGTNVGNENFADFDLCTAPNPNVCYTITAPCGTVTHVTQLAGNLQQGDTITATFSLPPGSAGMGYTLVSYTAPNGNFDTSNLQQQVIFDQQSTTASGKQTLTITVPNCYFQVDFVCGAAIDHLATNPNVYYHAQDRYIDGQQGGNQVCTASSISGNICSVANQYCGWQSSDPDLSGVTVTLTGTDYLGDKISLVTTTNKGGNYSFTGLQASDDDGYTITVTTPSGDKAVGTTVITIYLNTNTNDTGDNFCFTPTNQGNGWWTYGS